MPDGRSGKPLGCLWGAFLWSDSPQIKGLRPPITSIEQMGIDQGGFDILSFHSQIGQKRFHLSNAHVFGVALVMQQDVLPDRLGVVFETNGIPHRAKEFSRTGFHRGQRSIILLPIGIPSPFERVVLKFFGMTCFGELCGIISLQVKIWVLSSLAAISAMLSTTVTDTGQITVPEEIRQHLKLVSGSRVEFVIDEDGQVKIFPLNVAVEDLSGILHRPGMQRTSLEDMETAISEGANDWT